jgi:hypothetical protein
MPRNLGHCGKEDPSTLGRHNFSQFLGDFVIEGKLLKLGEAQMAKVVVPSHELSLFVSGGNLGVLYLLQQR